MHSNQDPKFRPSRIQQKKVDAGHSGKKNGRGFYNIQGNNFSAFIQGWLGRITIFTVLLTAWSQDLSDDEIPISHFPDIVINLSLPSNIVLASKGGYKTIDDGGVRESLFTVKT